uniref:Uncharacterized protein n=1 Tax=Chenopodium quinoa TaxID=63459 RepID=A0A803NDF7_CHEQI
MALTTVAGVSAAILQLRSDVKSSTAIFRRDVRQIRQERKLNLSKWKDRFMRRKLPRTISTKNLMSCLREEHGSLEALFVICPV